jgi:uncharacterized membrane protein YgcG
MQPSTQPTSSPTNALNYVTISTAIADTFSRCTTNGKTFADVATALPGKQNQYFCSLLKDSGCTIETIRDASCIPACLSATPSVFCSTFPVFNQSCTSGFSPYLLNALKQSLDTSACNAASSVLLKKKLNLSGNMTTVAFTTTFILYGVSASDISKSVQSLNAIKMALSLSIPGVNNVALTVAGGVSASQVSLSNHFIVEMFPRRLNDGIISISSSSSRSNGGGGSGGGGGDVGDRVQDQFKNGYLNHENLHRQLTSSASITAQVSSYAEALGYTIYQAAAAASASAETFASSVNDGTFANNLALAAVASNSTIIKSIDTNLIKATSIQAITSSMPSSKPSSQPTSQPTDKEPTKPFELTAGEIAAIVVCSVFGIVSCIVGGVVFFYQYVLHVQTRKLEQSREQTVIKQNFLDKMQELDALPSVPKAEEEVNEEGDSIMEMGIGTGGGNRQSDFEEFFAKPVSQAPNIPNNQSSTTSKPPKPPSFLHSSVTRKLEPQNRPPPPSVSSSSDDFMARFVNTSLPLEDDIDDIDGDL